MKKCKWAGDAGDEYCKNCDGCEVMFEGQKRIATDCAGYEEGTEDVEVTAEEVLPFGEDEVKEEKPKKKVTKKKEEKKVEQKKEEVVKNETTDNSGSNNSNTIPNSNPNEVVFTNSKVKSIKIMSGATREVDGVYYKFTYEQENEMNPDATEEQIAEERAKLWDLANAEIDKQLADVLN